LPVPAITVLLDIAPETAVRRKSSGRDKYERDLELLGRVRMSYQRQAAAQGWVRINAEAEKDVVARLVEAAVLPRFARP
jgi:thymidylate kinase